MTTGPRPPRVDTRVTSAQVQQIRHRTKRLIAVGGVVVLLGAVVGLLGWRWGTADPTPEMEEALATFPIPDGWAISEPIQAFGDRPAVCDWKPSCQNLQSSLEIEDRGDQYIIVSLSPSS